MKAKHFFVVVATMIIERQKVTALTHLLTEAAGDLERQSELTRLIENAQAKSDLAYIGLEGEVQRVLDNLSRQGKTLADLAREAEQEENGK